MELNGYVIVDADISKLDPKTFMYDEKKFKGRTNTEGYFGFAGHGAAVKFRDVRIKKLK